MEKAGETPTEGKEIGKIVFIVRENSFEVLVSSTISSEDALIMLLEAVKHLTEETTQTSGTIH